MRAKHQNRYADAAGRDTLMILPVKHIEDFRLMMFWYNRPSIQSALVQKTESGFSCHFRSGYGESRLNAVFLLPELAADFCLTMTTHGGSE